MTKLNSFYMMDNGDYANETQFVATRNDIDAQWAEYQQEFDLSENGYISFVNAWVIVNADYIRENSEDFIRYVKRGIIYNDDIVRFIQSVLTELEQIETELNEIMTASEIVEEFALSDSTVRVAISRGQIQARKSGGTWLIRRKDAVKKWGLVKWVDCSYEEYNAPGYNYVAAPKIWEEGATGYQIIKSNFDGGYPGRVGKMSYDPNAPQSDMLVRWYFDEE